MKTKTPTELEYSALFAAARKGYLSRDFLKTNSYVETVEKGGVKFAIKFETAKTRREFTIRRYVDGKHVSEAAFRAALAKASLAIGGEFPIETRAS